TVGGGSTRCVLFTQTASSCSCQRPYWRSRARDYPNPCTDRFHTGTTACDMVAQRSAGRPDVGPGVSRDESPGKLGRSHSARINAHAGGRDIDQPQSSSGEPTTRGADSGADYFRGVTA